MNELLTILSMNDNYVISHITDKQDVLRKGLLNQLGHYVGLPTFLHLLYNQNIWKAIKKEFSSFGLKRLLLTFVGQMICHIGLIDIFRFNNHQVML